ncbi:hypothetical protein MMC11_001222 [Xylographa trunciseda]|nr:hypothetical protein [Xylographa trunciseda]
MPKSILPCELGNLDWPEIESSAFQTFISDYCISSSNRTVSRGYLNGLESLIVEAGPGSSIAKSCKIISLANLGKKAASHMILQKAETLYFDLLPSFRWTISNEGKSTTIQSLITAVLLGLYEIITSTSTELGSHVAHARGVSAILTNKYSPFDLVCGGQLFQLPNPLSLKDLDIKDPENIPTPTLQTSEKFSIVCMPLVNSPWATLDPIFLKTISLIRKAEKLLSDETGATTIDDLQLLKQEAELLRTDYQKCVMNLSKEWSSSLIGIIPSNSSSMRPEVGYWPGSVLGYYDLYVACVINSYHKSQLLVLNVIVRCHWATVHLPQNAEIDPLIWEEAQNLTLGIVASIPYYLAENVQVFMNQTLASGMTSKAMTPGPSVGGLLSMHTLYMMSKLSVVDSVLKDYLKDCLAWIGRNMGIGQATMLSKHTSMDLSDYITQAHVLIWAGMLL